MPMFGLMKNKLHSGGIAISMLALLSLWGCSAKLVDIEQQFSASATPALNTLKKLGEQARHAEYQAVILRHETGRYRPSASAANYRAVQALVCRAEHAALTSPANAANAVIQTANYTLAFQEQLDSVATTAKSSLLAKSQALLKKLNPFTSMSSGQDSVAEDSAQIDDNEPEVSLYTRLQQQCLADFAQLAQPRPASLAMQDHSEQTTTDEQSVMRKFIGTLNQFAQVIEKEKRAALIKTYASAQQAQVLSGLNELQNSGALAQALTQSRLHYLAIAVEAYSKAPSRPIEGQMLLASQAADAIERYQQLLPVNSEELLQQLITAYSAFFALVASHPNLSPDQFFNLLADLAIIDTELAIVQRAADFFGGSP